MSHRKDIDIAVEMLRDKTMKDPRFLLVGVGDHCLALYVTGSDGSWPKTCGGWPVRVVLTKIDPVKALASLDEAQP